MRNRVSYAVILSPFAVILRSAAVLSGAKELLLVKQMPRKSSAQAPDLLVPAPFGFAQGRQGKLREEPAFSLSSQFRTAGAK